MGDKKKAETPIEKPLEKEFPLSVLRKNSIKLFGVTTATFDGAMSEVEGPLTIAEARNTIDAWSKKGAN